MRQGKYSRWQKRNTPRQRPEGPKNDLHFGRRGSLLATLGMVPMPAIPMPIQGRVIVEPRDIEPPPPPQPTIPPPRIQDYVPPIIEVPLEPETGRNAITIPEPSPTPPPVVLTPPHAIMATHTIPNYPPVSRRLGEQGTLRLQLAIGADGAVQEARAEASSGYTRLDEAAVQWVKAHWRYEPAMQGSNPVSSTATAEVTFRLK